MDLRKSWLSDCIEPNDPMCQLDSDLRPYSWFRTKNVLAGAVFFFGFMIAILLMVGDATGGTCVPAAFRGRRPRNKFSYLNSGDYNTNAIIVI